MYIRINKLMHAICTRMRIRTHSGQKAITLHYNFTDRFVL